MKRKAIIVLVLFLLSFVTAYGNNNICLYKHDWTGVKYEVVDVKDKESKINEGYCEISPYTNYGEVVLYSGDFRACAFPYEMASTQTTVGWHWQPLKIMYSADSKTITVPMEHISEYEKVGWYKEPVALVTNGIETKYILKSELELYRLSGWQILRYGPELYYLGEEIQNYIRNKSGKYGIYVKNLNSGEELIINDGQYSAASIIKLFVMTGVYNEIAYGGIVKNKTISGKLYNMITVSDNYSSNYLVKMIGKGNYKSGFDAENLMSRSIGCYNTNHRSLFIGYGDYVSYGRNTVSPVDCGIVLEKIYKGELINPELSYEMLSLLKGQQRRNKIPYLLPNGTVCANKTGETSTVQSDVGIVYSPNADYVICVLTNNSPTGITDIRKISRIVYDYFN